MHKAQGIVEGVHFMYKKIPHIMRFAPLSFLGKCWEVRYVI